MDIYLRVITSGLHFRNILEATENLTLNCLLKFIQSCFVEKIATDLYQALTLRHYPRESTMQFTNRAMNPT